MIVDPFVNEIAALPLPSRQRIPPLPSAPKWPTSATDHVVGALPAKIEDEIVGTLLGAVTLEITTPPVVELRHRMSARPSLSKSPMPATFRFEPHVPSERDHTITKPTMTLLLDATRAIDEG